MCVIWRGGGKARGAAQNKTWRTRVFCASVGCSLTEFPVMVFSFLCLRNCFYLCKMSGCKALPVGSGTLLFPRGTCFAHSCEMAQRSHLLHCLQYPRMGGLCIYSCNYKNPNGRRKSFVLYVDQKPFQTWAVRQKIQFCVRLEL